MLNLYRRHRQDFEAGRRKLPYRGKEERKKGWKRCACLIFASGTLPEFGRRSTFLTDWEQAKNLTCPAGPLGQGTGSAWARACGGRASSAPDRTTIAASQGFLDDQKDEAAKSTVRMYRYLMNWLKEFATEKGYTFIDQLERASVAAFEETWKVGSIRPEKQGQPENVLRVLH